MTNCSSTEYSRSTVVGSPLGYPRLAAMVDSDNNFMQYRRFGFLQTRILLNKQDELRELEYRLDRLDGLITTDSGSKRWIHRSRAVDLLHGNQRSDLLAEIEAKFKEYGESNKHQKGKSSD